MSPTSYRTAPLRDIAIFLLHGLLYHSSCLLSTPLSAGPRALCPPDKDGMVTGYASARQIIRFSKYFSSFLLGCLLLFPHFRLFYSFRRLRPFFLCAPVKNALSAPLRPIRASRRFQNFSLSKMPKNVEFFLLSMVLCKYIARMEDALFSVAHLLRTGLCPAAAPCRSGKTC